MNSSQLVGTNSWSPETFDFKHCYKIIAGMIEKTEPTNIEAKLKEWIDTGKIKVTCRPLTEKEVRDIYDTTRWVAHSGTVNYTLPLHKEVINNLKSLL